MHWRVRAGSKLTPGQPTNRNVTGQRFGSQTAYFCFGALPSLSSGPLAQPAAFYAKLWEPDIRRLVREAAAPVLLVRSPIPGRARFPRSEAGPLRSAKACSAPSFGT